MEYQLTYDLDEFQPIPGLAVYLYGSAEIVFDDDGEWSVDSISLTTDAGGEQELDKPSAIASPAGFRDHLYIAIKTALYQRCSVSIQSIIDERLSEERANHHRYAAE